MTDQERLDQINTILAGPERTAIGDRLVQYDFDNLRKERDDLLRKMRGGSSYRRVVFSGR